MKYGLLIQGPLLSVGRTGATGHKPFSDASVVRFDCRETIQGSISKYGHLFSEIVVSTWDDGVFSDFNVAGARMRRIPDTAGAIKDQRVKAHWANKDLANNMLKQYRGVYEGLLHINEADFVVKIRTDQSLRLDLLVQSLSHDDRIYVPYFARGVDEVPDFYLGARRNIMLDLFGILTKPGHMTSSPHQDVVLRYAFERYFNLVGVEEGWYNEHPTAQRSRIFAFMLNKVFSAFPREVYESLIWRGCAFPLEYRKTFDEFCFVYPDFYPKPPTHVGIENALFRTRKTLIARFIQKSLLFMSRLTALIFNRIFK